MDNAYELIIESIMGKFFVWIGVSHFKFLWIDSNGAMVTNYLSRLVDVLRETRLTMWYAFGLQPSGLDFG